MHAQDSPISESQLLEQCVKLRGAAPTWTLFVPVFIVGRCCFALSKELRQQEHVLCLPAEGSDRLS